MNTKTFFSQFSEFSEQWKIYKEQIHKHPLLKHAAKHPTGWFVISDYCLDDENKNDCITFTICPAVDGKCLSAFMQKNLPKDIKDMTTPTDDEIKFIKDDNLFFAISILIKEKKKCFDFDAFKKYIGELKEAPCLNDQEKESFKNLHTYLQKKNVNQKLIKNMIIIKDVLIRIIEFLTIKHDAKEIYWFPDRDAVMDVADGVIINLINTESTQLVGERKTHPNITFHGEDKGKNIFAFDSLVRYSDIITGVISSIDPETLEHDKSKHADLFLNAIWGNPRIIFMEASPENLQSYGFKVLPFPEKVKNGGIIRFPKS